MKIIKDFIRRVIPDKTYIKLMFKKRMGYKLNLKNPRDYNEKLQWLKLYDRNPKYAKLVDKFEVREYIKETIGEEYLIPLYGVYNNYSDILFEDLPNSFVIKATHTSGDVIIVKDKNKLNYLELEKTIKKWLKRKYFYYSREWPYKGVKPRIIIEKYMVDESNIELKDYKFFCFNGKPKYLFIASGRNNKKELTFDYYDIKLNKLDLSQKYPNSDKVISKINNYEKMIEISKQLSEKIPHVRVDLYNINGKIYFGELTFFHFSGMEPFKPKYWDEKFGEQIKL